MVDKLETFAERLKFLRKKSGLSLAAVARQIGVTPQAVHKWENGGKVDSDRDWVLADLFEVNPMWLIRGDIGETEEPLQPRNPGARFLLGSATVPKPPEEGVFVPIIGPENVVDWIGNSESPHWNYNFHNGDWIACPAEHGGSTFALVVQGVSMENLGSKISYSQGDIIFVDPEAPVKSGSRVIFSASKMAKKLDVVFRQLILEGDERFWRPLNPQWPQAITPVDERHIVLGVVIGKWVPEA